MPASSRNLFLFLSLSQILFQCSWKFTWFSRVTLEFFGLRVVGSLMPSLITFSSRENSLVHTEKAGVVDLSFDRDRFLILNQLRRFRY